MFFVASCIQILAIDARIAVVSLVIVAFSRLLLPNRLVSIEVLFMLNVAVVFFILLSHQMCVLETQMCKHSGRSKQVCPFIFNVL